jgi:hypothetical protein
VFQRAHDVDVQRIAVAVGLGFLRPHLGQAAMVRLVAADAIAQQGLIDVAQRQLSDLAHAFRRELDAAAARSNVARLGEQQQELPELLHLLRRLVAEQGAQVVEADGLQPAGKQVFLELLEALHFAHQLERGVIVERLGALEQLAVAALKALQRAHVLELLEQALELGPCILVFELVAAQLLDRVREAARQAIELLAFGLGRRVGAPLQRVALEIEQLLQTLGDRIEGALEIVLALALAHRLAQRLEEIVDSHDAHALELEAVAQQPVERLLDVVGIRQVLGELLEDLVSRELDALRAVPLGVADQMHAGFSSLSTQRRRDAERCDQLRDLSASLRLCVEEQGEPYARKLHRAPSLSRFSFW